MDRFLRTSVALFCVALALSACATDRKHGLCPTASVLSNTANATVFKDKMSGDPSGILYEVAITGVTTDCSFDKNEGTADSSVTVTFHATRTPTGEAAEYSVPYYLAVTRDSTTIVSKQILTAAVTFQPGEASTTFTADVPSTEVRLDNGKKPYDYAFLTGLQMTQAQLDYNKKMGRFTP